MTDTAKNSFSIRPLHPADAAAAAGLSTQLGYPASAETIAQRLLDIAAAADQTVLGAYRDKTLLGWIDVAIVQHLQSGKFGEIGGLVVASAARGQGIGSALVRAAEEWVASRGVDTMVVRSQIARESAHAFYLRRDYTRIKTSAVFRKPLFPKII